ncbi:MAG TPA: cytochrome c-type biogenesis protein [Bauldia sp.]|nr:cytochrome c-type biogenesis protein [Bauldia sp.]
MSRAALLLLLLLMALPAHAVQPSEMLPDPALEARARTLSAELRCMVCQNQSIDDSDAPLAADIRVLLRERITAGDSDQQVIDFLVARYGEFILLKPQFNAHTALLWVTPFAVLVLGAGIAALTWRRQRGRASPPLDPAEQEALRRLMSDETRRG